MIRALLVAALVLGACWASLGLLLFLCSALDDELEAEGHDQGECDVCLAADDAGVVASVDLALWASEMERSS